MENWEKIHHIEQTIKILLEDSHYNRSDSIIQKLEDEIEILMDK